MHFLSPSTAPTWPRASVGCIRQLTNGICSFCFAVELALLKQTSACRIRPKLPRIIGPNSFDHVGCASGPSHAVKLRCNGWTISASWGGDVASPDANECVDDASTPSVFHMFKDRMPRTVSQAKLLSTPVVGHLHQLCARWRRPPGDEPWIARPSPSTAGTTSLGHLVASKFISIRLVNCGLRKN